MSKWLERARAGSALEHTANSPQVEDETPPLEMEQEERAAIIEEGARVPREWADGFARLLAAPPPAGVSQREWVGVLTAAGHFLDQWALTARDLGWTPAELFGLDPDAPLARRDRRGAAFFLASVDVVAITADAITVRSHGLNPSTARITRRGVTSPLWGGC